MRTVFLILVLAVTATTLIHLRREDRRARYQAQRLELQAAVLRRDLGNQQLLLADQTRPTVVRRRADEMALNLRDTTQWRPRLAAIHYQQVPQQP